MAGSCRAVVWMEGISFGYPHVPAALHSRTTTVTSSLETPLDMQK